MTCEEVRQSLGAHALGALDPEEAEEIDLHLATCEECGRELVELEGVAGFLGKVSERDVELVSSPPRQVLERLLTDRAKRRRRGRALMAVVAAAAVVGVGGVVWTVVPVGGSAPVSAPAAQRERASDDGAARTEADTSARQGEEAATMSQPEDDPAENPAEDPSEDRALKADSSESPPAEPRTARSPSSLGRAFDGADDATGYHATVTATPDGPGTELSVHVTGVPVGTECRLVVVTKDGSRRPTGSWRINRRTYEENTVVQYETSTALTDIAAFEITGKDGDILIRVPVTGT